MLNFEADLKNLEIIRIIRIRRTTAENLISALPYITDSVFSILMTANEEQ